MRLRGVGKDAYVGRILSEKAILVMEQATSLSIK
jgi:hypothetical protein